MTPLAAYLLLFVAVGAGFILVHLLAGKLIRPSKPDAEKGTIYECGEPTIGSAWVQFDLRYYVVALLFVIFDVEVAFFFPWAEVFGKANAIATASRPETPAQYRDYARKVLDLAPPISATQQKQKYEQYEKIAGQTAAGQPLAGLSDEELQKLLDEQKAQNEKYKNQKDEFVQNQESAGNLAWLAFGEVLVFFGVLLVGFAYLWRRGDLAWVRSVGDRHKTPPRPEGRGPVVPPAPVPAGSVLVSAGERH
jgi:NADH-quinone oxidoreductase subunit A